MIKLWTHRGFFKRIKWRASNLPFLPSDPRPHERIVSLNWGNQEGFTCSLKQYTNNMNKNINVWGDLPDRDPLDKDPPRTENPWTKTLWTEAPWTETPLWTESQTGVKTLPCLNKVKFNWLCLIKFTRNHGGKAEHPFSDYYLVNDYYVKLMWNIDQ